MFGYVLPVDGAGAGPEVVVLWAVVVVEVELGDAGLEEFEGFVDADVLFGGQVGVADVEADAYAVEVADTEDFEDVSGVVISFCRFSMRMRTPRGWAKALRCSMAVREFSRARVFQGSSLWPRWRTQAVMGICSADSRARLTSSMAAMRWDFSGSMRLRLGATWRDHCRFRGR